MSKKKFKADPGVWASGGRMKCHTLKSWPEHFQPVIAGLKLAELRIMDRDFSVGDFIILSEYIPEGTEMLRGKDTEISISAGEFSGAWAKIRIVHISKVDSIVKGYGLLSFALVEHGQLSMKDMMQINLLDEINEGVKGQN